MMGNITNDYIDTINRRSTYILKDDYLHEKIYGNKTNKNILVGKNDFVLFKDVIFGGDLEMSLAISMAELRGYDKGNIVKYSEELFEMCIFENCTFHHCVFENCSFIFCDFKECKFEDVHFTNCTFPFFDISRLHDTDIYDYASCYFESCEFWDTNFINNIFVNTIFNETYFTHIKFSNSYLDESLLFDCSFRYRCVITNSKLYRSNFISINQMDIDFVNCEKAFSKETVFHCFDLLISLEDYNARYLSLIKISDIFKNMGYTDISWDYYYIAKRNETKSLSGTARIVSGLADLLCGYGERPSRTFIFIVANILLFGLIYLFSGFTIDNRLCAFSEIKTAWPQNIIELFKLYCHSVFFSITTFSTVGYGNYVPEGVISCTFASIQMIMGVFLTALWTGCIFRKIAR